MHRRFSDGYEMAIDQTLSNPMASDPTFANCRYIPPWKESFIIGIAGCSGSGKTSIAQSVIQKLNVPWTVLLAMDNFYKPLNKEAKELAFQSEYDFDRPEAIDMDLLLDVLKKLKSGCKVEIPIYSFKEHDRTDKKLTIFGANVIIVEGIYALYDPRIAEMMDIKVFVDTELDICLARRLSRDILDRKRELVLSIKQWEKFVKPNFEKSIYPSSKKADILIPRGLDNSVGINLLVSQILNQLAAKSSQHMTDFLALDLQTKDVSQKNVTLIKQTSQVVGIQTILSDRYVSRADFMFYFDRMANLLIYKALDFLPASSKSITTPTQAIIEDSIQMDFEKAIAVTMIRGGECFIKSLRETVPDIRIGKLLILSDTCTGEPQLHNFVLPSCISQQSLVLLADTEILSGAAATMATAVLIDHGVLEENIVFVVYRATKIGLARLITAFPKIRIVVGLITDLSAGIRRYVDTLYYGT